MKIEELVPIELNGQRLVTNKQLADFYGVTPTRIKDNFRKSKKHFVEGVHYFKISGEELKALKAQLSEIIMGDVSENFRHVYDPATVKSVFSASNTLVLYTERGAAMHCKSLRTDKAWEVHAELVRGYFDSAAESPAETPINTPADRVKELEEENARLRAQLEEDLCCFVVYVLLMSNGTVKIGMTSNLTNRIRQIKSESKLEVLKCASSCALRQNDAALLERILHDKFSAHSLGGEFFNIKFVEAVKYLVA